MIFRMIFRRKPLRRKKASRPGAKALMRVHRAAQEMTPERWGKLWVDFAGGEAVGIELPAFPDERIQRITNSMSGAVTMAAALPFYRIADHEISTRFPDSSRIKLLDYGAGWGRITRLMLRTIEPSNLHAVDVDHRLVRAGKALLPGVVFTLIESGKPLPFEDGWFDVAISNSVFSHLSQAAHLFYVREIARILRPGGLFLCTTLGPHHFESWIANDESTAWITDVLGSADTVRAQLSAGQFVFGRTRPHWADYGIAVVPPGWIAENWKPKFDLVETRTDYSQDVQVALRR